MEHASPEMKGMNVSIDTKTERANQNVNDKTAPRHQIEENKA